MFKATLREKTIDGIIWVSVCALIKCYILPAFGLSADFGPMFASGLVASVGGFELLGQIARLVGDMDGDRTITYQLTLPLPSWMVWFKEILVCALRALFLSLLGMVVAKILLWNIWSWAAINYVQLACILLVGSCYLGTYCLFLTSFTPSLKRFERTHMRILWPLWFWGGHDFSWFVLNRLYAKLSYLFLLNPELHHKEAMRAAFLGQQNFLPFWVSLSILFLFSVLFIGVAMRRLKRRLNYV